MGEKDEKLGEMFISFDGRDTIQPFARGESLPDVEFLESDCDSEFVIEFRKNFNAAINATISFPVLWSKAIEKVIRALREFTNEINSTNDSQKSNNWLKMHGYPMRRRIHKRR